jgi:hypothetical protein
MTENRTTAISGSYDLTGDPVPRESADSAGLMRTARAVVRLARAHRRLDHVPTPGQVRAMAWFDGREPCSYLLDRAVNFVPEPMEFGYERELGEHALAFACRDTDGRAMELVTMRDGGGFDLLGI